MILFQSKYKFLFFEALFPIGIRCGEEGSALSDEVDHFPHSVIGGGGFLYDPFNRGEIGDADFTAQGKGQQVAGQGTGEASFFSEDGVLELNYVAEVMFPKRTPFMSTLRPFSYWSRHRPTASKFSKANPKGSSLA